VGAGSFKLEEDLYQAIHGDLFTKQPVAYLMVLAENAAHIAGRKENISRAH
jgi:hypothetical protein